MADRSDTLPRELGNWESDLESESESDISLLPPPLPPPPPKHGQTIFIVQESKKKQLGSEYTKYPCRNCKKLHTELMSVFSPNRFQSEHRSRRKSTGETSMRSIPYSNIEDLSLGSVGDLRNHRVECPSCQDLSDILGLENQEIDDSAVIQLKKVRYSHQWDETTLIVEKHRQFDSDVRWNDPRVLETLLKIYVDSPELQSTELFLAPACDPDADFGFPAIRSIDPDVLDVNFARACFERCQSSHGPSCCNVDALIPNFKPNIYLLDLESRCLVKATVDHVYVALSYVWGQDSSDFECRKGNLKQFLEPGSLDDSDFFAIPPLVSSAMDFTRQMGQRFFWIDRYCIVQDDGGHKHEQIMAMGTIYANACFTIVSADGDASVGIPGIGTTATHGTRQRNLFTYVGDTEILYGMRYKSIPANTSWASRGWTFQEQMFSRRLVIFFQGQFIWKCRKSLYQEAFNNEVVLESWEQRSFLDSLRSPGWPDNDLYRRLVENYSKRTLSFPCDSISAFSGILTTLRNSFPGGFLFGLPESYFDIALLWQPGVPVQDRYQLASAVGKPTEPLPSWSWGRWQGTLNFGNWLAGNDCLLLSFYTQNICSISPIVTWSKFNTASGARTQICNSYADFRIGDHIGDGGQQLEYPDRDYRFRFPVPLPTSADLDPEKISEKWNTTIAGTVKRTFVVIGEEIPLTPSHEAMLGICSWRYLQNQAGETIGVVCCNIVHSSKRNLYTRETSEPSPLSNDGDRAEMIAISKGEFHISLNLNPIGYPEKLFQQWELVQRQKDRVYKFYNVMWIERADGVATRRALGRVLQRAWDGLGADTIDIVLG